MEVVFYIAARRCHIVLLIFSMVSAVIHLTFFVLIDVYSTNGGCHASSVLVMFDILM